MARLLSNKKNYRLSKVNLELAPNIPGARGFNQMFRLGIFLNDSEFYVLRRNAHTGVHTSIDVDIFARKARDRDFP